jgi:hypothetical protein
MEENQEESGSDILAQIMQAIEINNCMSESLAINPLVVYLTSNSDPINTNVVLLESMHVYRQIHSSHNADNVHVQVWRYRNKLLYPLPSRDMQPYTPSDTNEPNTHLDKGGVMFFPGRGCS